MGAAANRIKNLADGLKDTGNKVTIICPLPNYPKGEIFSDYKNSFFNEEIIDGIKVKRYWVYPSKSKNAAIRILSMLSFAISLWFSFFSLLRKRPDIFIIQSPPLLVAFSGLLLSKILFCKNVLNVSDIWPLSALELKVIKKGFFYSFLEKLERLNYKLANRIIGQSEEIICHVKKIVNKDFLVYRNVPKFKKFAVNKKSENQLKIVYAGLLGYAQGILQICEEINFKELGIEFHIYGAGMDEEKINQISKTGDKNVFFHGVKTSKEIKREIIKYDIGLVPLKNKIYGAVPSKIFEMMQLGIPMLFVGSGEASDIINKQKLGLVSEPNDYITLYENILKFKNMKKNEFSDYSKNCINIHKQRYNLDLQMKKILEFI